MIRIGVVATVGHRLGNALIHGFGKFGRNPAFKTAEHILRFRSIHIIARSLIPMPNRRMKRLFLRPVAAQYAGDTDVLQHLRRHGVGRRPHGKRHLRIKQAHLFQIGQKIQSAVGSHFFGMGKFYFHPAEARQNGLTQFADKLHQPRGIFAGQAETLRSGQPDQPSAVLPELPLAAHTQKPPVPVAAEAVVCQAAQSEAVSVCRFFHA